jgi:hypothetical protein
VTASAEGFVPVKESDAAAPDVFKVIHPIAVIKLPPSPVNAGIGYVECLPAKFEIAADFQVRLGGTDDSHAGCHKQRQEE